VDLVAAMRVHAVLGNGFQEVIYRRAWRLNSGEWEFLLSVNSKNRNAKFKDNAISSPSQKSNQIEVQTIN
jgi:hypothetical protein